MKASRDGAVPELKHETLIGQFADEVPVEEGFIVSDIPARLDRLPWSRFHWLIIAALGCSWIMDGLNVTILGVIGSILKKPDVLNLTDTLIGAAATCYIIGCCTGSLFFGYIGDKWGRKNLFMTTPLVYLSATVLTGFTWNFSTLALCQFFSGFGVGGEYSAINSTIDEFIPARVRGTVDLGVMGTYWLGAVLGSSISVVLLNDNLIPLNYGWRIFFLLGGFIGFVVLCLRRLIPESPRWLLTHGRAEEAETIVQNIEASVFKVQQFVPLSEDTPLLKIYDNSRPVDICTAIRTIFVNYPSRAFLGITLMISQSFFYNAIFFTYSLVLTTFYDVHEDKVGLYLIGFCIGNFLGPSTLGRLFDVIGRVQMISLTYCLSGILLLLTGLGFIRHVFNGITQTLCWSVVFYIASSAASSAYLTVSEVFPLEVRAMAIALCYSIGTAVGGGIGPIFFGALIESKTRVNVFYGYICACVLMFFAAAVECKYGVRSEQQALESIAAPVCSVDAQQSNNNNSNNNNNNNRPINMPAVTSSETAKLLSDDSMTDIHAASILSSTSSSRDGTVSNTCSYVTTDTHTSGLDNGPFCVGSDSDLDDEANAIDDAICQQRNHTTELPPVRMNIL